MVQLIGKVSKGSKMDQIYISKTREGFSIGSYVVIKPLETKPEGEIKPFFYDIRYLEPIKVKIAKEIFKTIDQTIKAENILVTGSFLDEGFAFHDIDVMIISEEKADISHIRRILNKNLGARFHLILINNKTLIKGLSTDPLYRDMLSRCVSKRRLIYRVRSKINYKLLDLHLLKSRLLIDNFDFLTGDEKYGLVRNLVAIKQFIAKKEVTKKGVNTVIDNLFGDETVQKLKNNSLPKDFLEKYKKVYDNTRNRVLKGIENESKQK